MPIQQLTLESPAALDMGKVAVALDMHLKRAALDCYDRPGDKAARKVPLTFELKPVLESDGGCTEVQAQVKASSSVPTHKTKVYSLGLKPSGQLVFNADSPESIDQTTLFEGDES